VLRNRLLVASVLLSLTAYALNEGGPFFFSLVAVLILLSGYEFFELIRRAGYQPLMSVGLGLVAIFLLQAYAHADWTRDLLIITVGATLIAAVFRSDQGWLVGWALTIVGALYAGGLGAYFILMRQLPDGQIWGTMAAFSTFAMDTAAYTVGKRWGKRPFFPRISPKKTLEGAIGGWAWAIIAMLIMGWLYGHTNPRMTLVHTLALGVGIALIGTFGDLAESVIKRQVGAKDSSALLGAHGGILDRLDSLLFVAPFVYYYAIWVLGM
jgi:phosphatidate cytidylyltransferase